MGSEQERINRSKRKFKARMKMIRQVKIAKAHVCLPSDYDSIHVFHKRKALNCGKSTCFMCGNPRKFFGELTLQEKRHDYDPIEELAYYED